METPLLNEHRAAGARLGEFSECVLPEGFSGFENEYRAAREAVALLDTNWHAVMHLTGPDRVRYLNAIVSNNVQSLAEGRGTLALLLNPQGHILAELEIYTLPDKLLVLSHASVRTRTASTLDKYIVMDNVQLDDWTDQFGTVAIEGPRAAAIIRQASGVPLEDLPQMAVKEVAIERIPCQLLRRTHFGDTGAELVIRRDRLAWLWQKLLAVMKAHGGEPVGMLALNSLRLEAGAPWFPLDFNDSVIPHEAAIQDTHVSFSKGCYTGQEIVERVRSRGHANRKRVRLRFSMSQPPLPGTKLHAEGKEVGYVTSAAFSPRANVAIGMGYVRIEQSAPGSTFKFDGGMAAVE
jgi:folate-binding protein YgfZ